MVLERRSSADGHLHRLVVTHDANGWAVREELDTASVRECRVSDWQRAEREIRRFTLAYGDDRGAPIDARHAA